MNEYEINHNIQPNATVAVASHKAVSNFFNPRRFGLYCSKQIHEWKRGLTLQFLALAGIYTLLMFLFHHTDEEGSTPSIASTGIQIIIWLGFFVYIAKSASSLADQIGVRSKRVLYLAVPASTAEKYIAHLLWTAVLYPILFFAAILVAQYASEVFSSAIRNEPFNPGTPLQGMLTFWEGNLYNVSSLVNYTINIIVTFTLGATLWQKNSFLKTIAALFLLGIIVIIFYTTLLGKEELESMFTYLVVGNYFDNFDSTSFIWLINGVSTVEYLLFGYIGYMRMKELEINETKR